LDKALDIADQGACFNAKEWGKITALAVAGKYGQFV